MDKIVDITDPNCEFIKEMNKEINKYGALVYNYEYNSYQLIYNFDQIDYKKELLPDLIKVEDAGNLLKGMNITFHYDFDPETEDDKENLEIWQELSQIELPVFAYDEDGEILVDKTIYLYPSVSKHTIWYLTEDSYKYIKELDILLVKPIIKNLSIAQKLIKEYAISPFKEKKEHHVEVCDGCDE